jgi:hypothetical protein
MPKGGARVRSGPQQDPNSGRSDQRRRAAAAAAKKAASSGSAAASITTNEFNPMALPARGRTGRVPAFPLPKIMRFVMVPNPEGKPTREADSAVSNAFRKRELELWAQLWKTPQAVAWEREPYRWPTIAKYCRVMASTEAEPDASAALLSRERELRIECGLSPDGLKANGWAIAPDQLAEKRAAKKAAAPAKKAAAPVRRLRG